MFEIKLIKKNFIKLSSKTRFFYLILIDFFLILFSFEITSIIESSRYEYFISNLEIKILLAIGIIFIYVFCGIYKNLSRSIGSRFLYSQLRLNIYICFCIYFLSLFLKVINFDLQFTLIFGYFFCSLTIANKFIIKDTLLSFAKENQYGNVIIYGAGVAGLKLLEALSFSEIYNVQYFVDDNQKIWGRRINGIKVISPKNIKNVIKNIDSILIALPEVKADRFKDILIYLEQFNVQVLRTPSIYSLKNNKESIDALRSIEVRDLVERRSLELNNEILMKSISGKNICITGSGGSIGTELVRQIIKCSPNNLFLIDNSENNLYYLIQEVNSLNVESIGIKFSLLNCLEKNSLSEFFSKNEINYVFHAAAYKHVPIVEDNPLQGIRNNVLSTKNICEVALENEIEKVILISTDKAVRPTNIMGASKRVAEIIIQLFDLKSRQQNEKTIFSIVRFGNVLNSSGSVVPLFNKQIKEGGPITLTHPEIVRYFMTIPEATKLVLQASIMTKGGEVFLLDMGKPVKIYDLAKKMIKLSGLKIKDNNNPDGDIEIINTGLRPGEKLFEELLIDGNSSSTKHPLIFKSKEKLSNHELLWENIQNLEKSLNKNELKKVLRILNLLVPEWENSYNTN